MKALKNTGILFVFNVRAKKTQYPEALGLEDFIFAIRQKTANQPAG